MSADNGLTENTYQYDANGNRNGGSYDVGDGNRLTTDGVWNYFYDNEGNLIKRVNVTEGEDAGITWTYRYDNANHLIQAKLWDSDPDENEEAVLLRQATYVYDAFGNRVEKIVDWDGEGEDEPVVSKFAYDGWNNMKSSSPVATENFDVWADLDDASSLITRYVRGDAVDQLFASVGNDGDTLWNLTDHLGSIRDIIDNTGAVKDQITYDAFGNFTESDPEFGGRYKWTGREFDEETGLQFNRARYYNAETGRWISQDPLGFDAGDSNLYRYVNNRPTLNTDPSGKVEFSVIEGLVKGIDPKLTKKLTGTYAFESTRGAGDTEIVKERIEEAAIKAFQAFEVLEKWPVIQKRLAGGKEVAGEIWLNFLNSSAPGTKFPIANTYHTKLLNLFDPEAGFLREKIGFRVLVHKTKPAGFEISETAMAFTSENDIKAKVRRMHILPNYFGKSTFAGPKYQVQWIYHEWGRFLGIDLSNLDQPNGVADTDFTANYSPLRNIDIWDSVIDFLSKNYQYVSEP